MSGARYVGGPPRLISIAITIPLDMWEEGYGIDVANTWFRPPIHEPWDSGSPTGRHLAHVRLTQG